MVWDGKRAHGIALILQTGRYGVNNPRSMATIGKSTTHMNYERSGHCVRSKLRM